MPSGIKYLTEKEIAEQFSSTDYLIAIQTVTEVDDEDVETTKRLVRKITTEQIVNFLASALSNTSTSTAAVNSKLAEMYPNLVKSVEANQAGTALNVTYWDDEVIEIPYSASGGGGLSFNGGYVDEDGKLHFTLDGEDIDDFDPIPIPAGSGGGASGSKITFSLTSGLNFSVPESAATAPVTFNLTSIDTETDTATGPCTVQVFVGGTLRKSVTVQQGSGSIDVRQYLTTGSNTVKLVATDQYNATATRSCTITVEALSLSWTLDRTLINSGSLDFSLTPVGVGSKTLVIKVDGVQHSSDTVTTSGRRVTKSITGLTHGQHIIEAYCTLEVAGSTIRSNDLLCAVAQVDSTSHVPVIAAAYTDTTAQQYTNITIPFRVVDNDNNPATVSLLANGATVQTLSPDQTEQSWTYRPTASGTLVLAIVCGTTRWEKTITVAPLSVDVDEVTDDLDYKLDPATLSNLNAFTLSQNFDTVNGGIQTDGDGVKMIKVVKGDRLTVPFTPFADEAKTNGKSLKIIYKVGNCSLFGTTAISCYQSNIGFKINANSVQLKTEQESLEMQTCEGRKTELDFVIENNSAVVNDENIHNRIMTIWEDGVPSKMSQYGVDDNITQSSPVGITIGSDDCDVYVYLIRCYSTALSITEVKANYQFDGPNALEIESRYNKDQIYDNQGNIDVSKVIAVNPNAHVLTFHAAKIAASENDKPVGILTHEYSAGGVSHKWTAQNVQNKAQGTSSMEYGLSGFNQDFNCRNGFDYDEVLDNNNEPVHTDGYAMTENSMPVNYFNFKVNIASSEHVNNMLLSEWYNRYQPYLRPAREDNAKVRDCIEGHMAVLFFHNTGSAAVQAGTRIVNPGETVLYAVGNMNNSKKNLEMFAQNDEDDILVIEGRNNTSAQNRFKSDDLSNEPWDKTQSYEFRHKSDTLTTEQAAALWQTALSWVVSCDPDQATGDALDQSATYGGVTYQSDTAAYRKAKFKAELADHFIVDSLLYHYIFTLVFTMVDNRAKNLFWGYSASAQKWHLCFSYDHDTAMGNNNEGDLTLRYGYIDSDVIGQRSVFNAADSTLFVLLAECFADEAAAMYRTLENEGAWDLSAFSVLCDTEQEKICTSLWVEDAVKKYIEPLTLYSEDMFVSMLNGRKKGQRAQFLKFQEQFIASYFSTLTDRTAYVSAETNRATIRGYTPTTGNTRNVVAPASVMTITYYCDTFGIVKAGSEVIKVRATAGVPVTFTFQNVGVMNDTEITPYNSQFIQDIGDLSCLYPGACTLSTMIRLKKAIIGSSLEGYENANFSAVNVANCQSLEELNIENCPSFVSALDLSNNIMLKKLLTRGSGVTGVTFANGGKIAEARLNGIVSFTARGLKYLSVFTLEDYDSLTAMIVEDSPSINTITLIEYSPNLARLRLIDVLWDLDNSRLLTQLASLRGIDDQGSATNVAVITGTANVTDMSASKETELEGIFPNLNIVVTNYIQEHTVRFFLYEGAEEPYNTQSVEHGGSAVRPTNPTREPDVDVTYTFAGWSASFSNVLQDTDIYAVWTTATRQYTVRFYNRSTLLQTSVVDYGGSVVYTGDDLVRSGYLWSGWAQEATNVSSDMDIQATFEEPVLPGEIKDMTNYDYLASDYEEDNAAYTPAQIYAICAAGLAKTYFAVGDQIHIKLDARRTVQDTHIKMAVYGFNHFRLVGDTDANKEFANVVFGMIGSLVSGRAMKASNTNATVGGWPSTAIDEWLNDTFIKNNLPPIWRSVIKAVRVLSHNGYNDEETIVEAQDKLFLFSQREVFGNTGIPYRDEVDADAEDKMFPIFTNNNARIRKTYNGEGSAVYWWLRSPYSGSSSNFAFVNNAGTTSNNAATITFSIVFGFCI